MNNQFNYADQSIIETSVVVHPIMTRVQTRCQHWKHSSSLQALYIGEWRDKEIACSFSIQHPVRLHWRGVNRVMVCWFDSSKPKCIRSCYGKTLKNGREKIFSSVDSLHPVAYIKIHYSTLSSTQFSCRVHVSDNICLVMLCRRNMD